MKRPVNKEPGRVTGWSGGSWVGKGQCTETIGEPRAGVTDHDWAKWEQCLSWEGGRPWKA